MDTSTPEDRWAGDHPGRRSPTVAVGAGAVGLLVAVVAAVGFLMWRADHRAPSAASSVAGTGGPPPGQTSAPGTSAPARAAPTTAAGGVPSAVATTSAPVTSAPVTSAPVTSAPAGNFAALYARVSDGVVRLETTNCDGGGVGSGFLVAPDLVATVAHVVASAQTVIVKSGSTATTGNVVGIDPDREIALVRTGERQDGHVFRMAGSDPQVGVDVAAIGYPLAGDQSLTKGSVSGLGRRENVDGRWLDGLIQTDTAINPGNSGGPLLTLDGTVVGLVEAKNAAAENIGFAVPASRVSATFDRWRSHPRPPTVQGCGAPVGPQVTADVADISDHAAGPAVAAVLRTYATGINTGDYESAYRQLSSRFRARTSLAEFRAGEATSYLFGITLTAIHTRTGGRLLADVTFTSVQDAEHGKDGQTCSDWALRYTLVPGGVYGWQIDGAKAQDGSPSAC